MIRMLERVGGRLLGLVVPETTARAADGCWWEECGTSGKWWKECCSDLLKTWCYACTD